MRNALEFDTSRNGLRRRKLRFNPAWASTLSVVCRDLERQELWDVGVIQSLSRFFGNALREGERHRATERLFRVVTEKFEQGVQCGKHLCAGALSAAVCKTVVAPIERVRMDIVLSNTPHGPHRACLEILRTEGVAGFWRGNLLNIIRTAPFKAVNFYAFDVYCKLFMSISNREGRGDVERFTAGALAGVTALMACLPLDTIRTRLLSMSSRHQYNGVMHAFNEIVRQEGFSALYKGCIPGLMSIAPGSAVFYGVYGTLKQAHINSSEMPKGSTGMELPIGHSLLYGAIAGMCAEAVVYPLEVIRRQVQLQTGAIGHIVSTQGLGGFYAGCLLNTVQVLPSAALSYLAYEAFKAALRVENSKTRE